MRWRSGRRSGNVQDRRGAGGLALGGGIGTLVVIVLVMLMGGDPSQILQLLGGAEASSVDRGAPPEGQDERFDFAAIMMGSTEDVWSDLFAASGQRYQTPTLVVFSGSTRSACGYGTSATGPFYCPPDQNVYLDLTFFDQLDQLGGPGDFAEAYVIGHEVGHHVQNLLGTMGQMRAAQQGRSQADQNRLSVLLELQADCYAGVWAHHAEENRGWMEPGDVQEGLAAAAAIGDDRLLERAGREAVPESFTHGTAEQRQYWLSRGLETGDPAACDTFAG